MELSKVCGTCLYNYYWHRKGKCTCGNKDSKDYDKEVPYDHCCEGYTTAPDIIEDPVEAIWKNKDPDSPKIGQAVYLVTVQTDQEGNEYAGHIVQRRYTASMRSQLGKRVFLKKQDAEKAFEKLKQPEVRKDCFAYSEKEPIPGCTILRRLYCKTEKCRFYKTKGSLKANEK